MNDDQSRITDLESKMNLLLEYQEFITKHINETLNQLTPTVDPPHER